MSWVYYADRKPTHEDGATLVKFENGCVRVILGPEHEAHRGAIAWMPVSDLPPLPKRKIRRAPTQADLDKAMEPIPCWVKDDSSDRWIERLLVGVVMWGQWRYVVTRSPLGNGAKLWKLCEIEADE